MLKDPGYNHGHNHHQTTIQDKHAEHGLHQHHGGLGCTIDGLDQRQRIEHMRACTNVRNAWTGKHHENRQTPRCIFAKMSRTRVRPGKIRGTHRV